MATIRLPPDFKEFLKLLKEHDVRYLLIGAYAVNYHGYIPATGDMDVWIAIHPDNAQKMVTVLKTFGFENDPDIKPELFLQEKKIIRMGVPPVRLDITTSISGVEFDECYQTRVVDELDGIEVNLIDLENLKKNKEASERPKDIVDLKKLQQKKTSA
jgi:predicted nucleotidyltransferase